MRIEQDRLGQIKNWTYIATSLLLFLTWILSLAALTQSGGVDGRLAWVFGLVRHLIDYAERIANQISASLRYR